MPLRMLRPRDTGVRPTSDLISWPLLNILADFEHTQGSSEELSCGKLAGRGLLFIITLKNK